MQQPRRGRKRQSWEEEVAWRGGLGRDEVVRPVAQGASAEVIVAGGRRKSCREERKAGRRRERRSRWLRCH